MTPDPHATVAEPMEPGQTTDPAVTAPPDAPGDEPAPPLIDFSRAARRVRTSALVLGSLALVGWLVTGLVGAGIDARDLGAWGAGALAGMFLVEVVVVGGSALRGMIRAGDRGERLAGSDVGLLPPQVTRRRRSR